MKKILFGWNHCLLIIILGFGFNISSVLGQNCNPLNYLDETEHSYLFSPGVSGAGNLWVETFTLAPNTRYTLDFLATDLYWYNYSQPGYCQSNPCPNGNCVSCTHNSPFAYITINGVQSGGGLALNGDYKSFSYAINNNTSSPSTVTLGIHAQNLTNTYQAFSIMEVHFYSNPPITPSDKPVPYNCNSGFPDVTGQLAGVNYNWFKEDGVTRVKDLNGNTLAPSNSLSAEIVSANLVGLDDASKEAFFFWVSITDAYGCESGKGKVILQPTPVVVFEEDFDGVPVPLRYNTTDGNTLTYNGSTYMHTWGGTATSNGFCLGGPGNRGLATNPSYFNDNSVSCPGGPNWISYQDHTHLNNNKASSGKMLVVDMVNGYVSGNPSPSGPFQAVWRATVDIQGGKKYKFQAWGKNICSVANYYEPNLQLWVKQGSVETLLPLNETANNFLKLLASYGNWSSLTGEWNAPVNGNTQAVFEIRASVGTLEENDFALDDIVVTTSNRLSSPGNNKPDKEVCLGDPVKFVPSGRTATGKYKWYSNPYTFSSAFTPSNLLPNNSTDEHNFTPVTSTTYYVSSWDDKAGCESARTSFTVNVFQKPSASIAGFPFAPANSNDPYEVRLGYRLNLTASQDNPSIAGLYVNPILTYTWNWGDGTANGSGPTASHVYGTRSQPGSPYTITLTVSDRLGCQQSFTKQVYIYENLCDTYYPPGPGVFKQVPLTGSIVYVVGNCDPAFESAMDCMTVPATALSNVVASSSTTFIDSLVVADAGNPEMNPLLRGQGNWHAKASYSYNTPINNNTENYRAGTFSLSYPFNYQGREAAHVDAWVPGGKATLYSPSGEAVEERNALNIASAVKFSYNSSQPYLSAQNADYNSVLFESFENRYVKNGSTYYGEDDLLFNGVTWINTRAHSGLSSVRLNAGSSFGLKAFDASSPLAAKGLSVKVWAYINNPNPGALNLALAGSAPLAFTRIAQNGDWALYECVITSSQMQLGVSAVAPAISYGGSSSDEVYLDDVRMQPLDAQLKAYVYDVRTQNVLTIFDDQHFGLYYQYNSEGKLVRKLVETEQGLQTIEETQYNTPKVNR